MKTVTNLIVLLPLLYQPLLILGVQQAAHAQPTLNYATILQDTRNEPKVDGTFGFLYRTEDGISHGAKGDADGAVHGRFTYTDPTGLKVNFNYNAGSRATPGYTEDRQELPSAPAPIQQQFAYNQPQPAYNQPQSAYKPQTRPVQQQVYRQEPQYVPEPQPQYDAFDYQDDKYYQDPQPQYQPQVLTRQPQGNYESGSYSTELQYGGAQAQPQQRYQAQPRYDQQDTFGNSQDYTQAYFPRTKPPALRQRIDQQYYQKDNNF